MGLSFSMFPLKKRSTKIKYKIEVYLSLEEISDADVITFPNFRGINNVLLSPFLLKLKTLK